MKVVDASVALGWLLHEPSPAAAAVLEGHVSGEDALVAPELLHYEIANVLVRGAQLPAAEALEAYERFAAVDIETYSLGHAEYADALALAARHGITVYDASYVALARALGCRVVTADRRLARALASTGLVEST